MVFAAAFVASLLASSLLASGTFAQAPPAEPVDHANEENWPPYRPGQNYSATYPTGGNVQVFSAPGGACYNTRKEGERFTTAARMWNNQRERVLSSSTAPPDNAAAFPVMVRAAHAPDAPVTIEASNYSDGSTSAPYASHVLTTDILWTMGTDNPSDDLYEVEPNTIRCNTHPDYMGSLGMGYTLGCGFSLEKMRACRDRERLWVMLHEIGHSFRRLHTPDQQNGLLTEEQAGWWCKGRRASGATKARFWSGRLKRRQASAMESPRTPRCPRCRSDEVIPIVYGMPTPETVEEASAGRVALGGCTVWPVSPDRRCVVCGHEWAEVSAG